MNYELWVMDTSKNSKIKACDRDKSGVYKNNHSFFFPRVGEIPQGKGAEYFIDGA
jgi:hypothetical protein